MIRIRKLRDTITNSRAKMNRARRLYIRLAMPDLVTMADLRTLAERMKSVGLYSPMTDDYSTAHGILRCMWKIDRRPTPHRRQSWARVETWHEWLERTGWGFNRRRGTA